MRTQERTRASAQACRHARTLARKHPHTDARLAASPALILLIVPRFGARQAHVARLLELEELIVLMFLEFRARPEL